MTAIFLSSKLDPLPNHSGQTEEFITTMFKKTLVERLIRLWSQVDNDNYSETNCHPLKPSTIHLNSHARPRDVSKDDLTEPRL